MDAPLGSLPGDQWTPPANPTSTFAPTFSDAFSAAWDAYQKGSTLDRERLNQQSFMDDQLDAYRQKTGETLMNPFRLSAAPSGSPAAQQFADEEAKVKQKFADAGMPYPTDEDIVKGGIAKEHDADARFDMIKRAPQTLGSWAGRQIGELAGPATDPVNIGSMLLAPEAAGPARALSVGGAFAAGTAVSGAITYPYQKQVYPETTPGTVAEQALWAGLQGAGIELGGQAVGALAGMAFRRAGMAWRNFRIGNDVDSVPLVVKDTGNIAEKAGDLQAQQPFSGPTAGNAHVEAIRAAERAMLDRESFDLPPAAEAEFQKPHAAARLSEDTIAGLERHPNPDVQAIGGALRDVKPEWDAMQEAAARGERYDPTDHLRDAVDMTRASHDGGFTAGSLATQGDTLKSDLSHAFAGAFYRDAERTEPANRAEIAKNLRDFLKPQEMAKEVAEPRRGARSPEAASAINSAARQQKAEVTPEKLKAGQAELERLRDQGEGSVFVKDREGNVVESRLDPHMAEIERFEAAAKEVRGLCAGLGGEAVT